MRPVAILLTMQLGDPEQFARLDIIR